MEEIEPLEYKARINGAIPRGNWPNDYTTYHILVTEVATGKGFF